MRLSDKLFSIKCSELTRELDILLSKPSTVTISWWGQRLVTLEGYEGSIEINQLAERYLHAPVFYPALKTSIIDKLYHFSLWHKIRNLYERSEEELNKTCLYRSITTWMDQVEETCDVCSGIPMFVIWEWKYKAKVAFTAKQTQRIWPDEEQRLRTIQPIFLYGDSSEGYIGTRYATSKKETLDELVKKYISKSPISIGNIKRDHKTDGHDHQE